MWKRLFCVSKRKKCCFCVNLTIGVRLLNLYGLVVTTMQLFWIVFRYFIDENSTKHDNYSRIVSCKYHYLGFGYDMICNFFKGYINMFTLAFSIISMICGGIASGCGIYAWIRGFPFHETERYFYIHFIVTIFYVINFIIIQIVLSEKVVISILASFASAYVILTVNNLLWCFLVEVEKNYRMNREPQTRYIILNNEE
ncbi:unnamed protein product [Moneuplotes crassus]|uniref:Uncharacterized protein n=1 Tax=Euplotes crassus TaxID=5936 RepID=A0AAD1XXK7_EUPCR|nr:unnamed protein product [Moneuplotes crassus]